MYTYYLLHTSVPLPPACSNRAAVLAKAALPVWAQRSGFLLLGGWTLYAFSCIPAEILQPEFFCTPAMEHPRGQAAAMASRGSVCICMRVNVCVCERERDSACVLAVRAE